MKKFYLLLALLLILAGCGPVRYYRGEGYRVPSVQEQLDRRSYDLVIEREMRYNRRAQSRTGRTASAVDIPDFVISVDGDRLRNSREGHVDYVISRYRDYKNRQYRTIRFTNCYRYGHSIEGKYELTVYPNGYFRLTVRSRNDAVRHEYEGRMERSFAATGRYHRR